MIIISDDGHIIISHDGHFIQSKTFDNLHVC
jgi:hypothetical protein